MKTIGSAICAAVAAFGCVSSGLATDYVVTEGATFSTPLTGTDTLTVDLTANRGILALTGDNSGWSGVLDLQHGCVVISDAKTVGTAMLYCTNNVNENNQRESAFIFECLNGEMTIANDIRLSTSEKNIGWNARLVASSNSTVNLTGTLTLERGAGIRANGPWGKTSTLNIMKPVQFADGLTKTKYFAVNGGHLGYSFVNFAKPLDCEELYISQNNVAIRLLETGNKIAYVSAAQNGNSSVSFAKDDAINDTFLFRNKNSPYQQTLELDNTSQTTGGWKFDTVNNKVTVRNSNTNVSKRAALTAKVASDQTGMVGFDGAVDFTKTGAGTLTVTNAAFGIHGTLTVSEGTMCVTAGTNVLARAIVIDGGTLDLGGQTYSCPSLTMSAGTLRNGTLIAGRTDVTGGTVSADLRTQPALAKTGTGTFVLSAKPGATTYVSTNGLVCCYHFDQADFQADATKGMKYLDAGPYGYTLYRAWKNIDATCATTGMRFGDGCLRINADSNGTRLQYYAAGYVIAYPEEFPVGAEPHTVALYFKMDSGTTLKSRALFSLGPDGSECAKGSRMTATVDAYATPAYSSFYSNTAGISGGKALSSGLTAAAPDGRALDGQWHSLVQIWDGTIWRFYIDGERIYVTDSWCSKLTDAPALSATDGVFRLGGGVHTGVGTLLGCIDEFAIWKRALTEAEVMAYCANGVPTGRDAAKASLTVSGGEVELGTGVTLASDADYAVAAGATLKSAEAVSVGGTLTLGGTVDGDVELEDGVTLKGDGTTAVTGTVTVKGTGTFATDSTPAAYPATWDLFTAASYEGGEKLGGWTIEGANLRRHTSAFGVIGNRLWASASLYGMTVIVK